MNSFYVSCACSRLPAGVPRRFHHVCLGVLADHLHQAHESPGGGESELVWDDEAWWEVQM